MHKPYKSKQLLRVRTPWLKIATPTQKPATQLVAKFTKEEKVEAGTVSGVMKIVVPIRQSLQQLG